VKKTAALLLLGLVTANVLYAAEKNPAPAGAPAEQVDKQKIKSGDDYVTLNFTNIDISALVKVMSELMRRNFILDERVTGKVTLMTPTKISPDEAYQVFLSALEIKGFTAVEDGKITRIIPAATARQSGLKVYKDDDFNGQGFVTKLFRLSYVNPNEVVRTLTPLVSRDGSMISYPATNSLIITDSVHNIRKMESLLSALDIPAPEGKGKINVYYLKNANAEDFAKVMSALVARLPVPPAGGAQPSGPSTILEGQVTITADKATNSLIVVASPSDYETIKDVIQKLDIRRRQVYVEAAIIEMSLAKQRELGFEFQAANLNKLESSNKISGIGGTNFGNIGNVIANGPAGLASLNGLNVGAVKGTFTFKGVEYLNIGALLHALQTDGDVNVLSTPNILTTDNQKAEIMVGENIPFVTGQSQTAATAGQIFTQIDRKDVGITLKLTPQITSDDNVRLDVYQEISDITATPGLNPNIVGPSTSKRSASTTVVVKDQQTMVIGGLIRDNVTSSTSKVPLLGDIPILGWFFKYKTTKIEKTNLMIFITPYIIKNEGEAAELANKKGEALEEFRKEYRIEKKEGGPVFPQPVPPPSQEKPAAKTGSLEKNESIPAVQSAPTGSAAAVQSAPTGTTQPAPAEVVR
jgi:general secretion pathway protein D